MKKHYKTPFPCDKKGGNQLINDLRREVPFQGQTNINVNTMPVA